MVNIKSRSEQKRATAEVDLGQSAEVRPSGSGSYRKCVKPEVGRTGSVSGASFRRRSSVRTRREVRRTAGRSTSGDETSSVRSTAP